MKRPFLFLATAVLLLLPAAASAGDPVPSSGEGFRLLDATAASVNGEILFLSDVLREACLRRCASAGGGEATGNVPLQEARRSLIEDLLVLQEQRKLGLGAVDNAAIAGEESALEGKLAACADPCAARISPGEVREAARNRVLVREFLAKRVAVFVEVTDEEVRREIAVRGRRDGTGAAAIPEDRVREELRRSKAAAEVRNWLARAASNARISLSTLEER